MARPQLDDLRIGVLALEVGQVLGAAATRAADRLVVVARGQHVAVLVAQQPDQRALGEAQLLELVDQHVPEALGQPLAHVRALVQQPEGVQHEVARVERARLRDPALVRGVDLRELELARGGHPLGVALGRLREGLGVRAVVLSARHLVLQAVDAVHEAAQQRCRVATDLVVAQRQLVDPLPEHRHSVRAGDGREEGVEPRLERLVLEQPSGEGLRRGDPELLPGRLDRGLDLRAQHGGDRGRGRQHEDRRRGHSLVDEPGEAARHDAGLAGARTAHDEHRAPGVADRVALGVGQAVEGGGHRAQGYVRVATVRQAMVDWSLAHRVARFAAGDSERRLDADLGALASEAAGAVSGYTGLAPGVVPPSPEPVSRADWADINLDTLAELLAPVAERLEGRLAAAGPLSGALRAAGSATLAAEAGLVVGYMSQRVLGQYELSLLAPERPARLLIVGPNIRRAIAAMEVDADSFLRWIVLHEVTHVLQFEGVPWLRGYLGDLLREYLRTVEVRIERGAAGGLPSLPEPARIVELWREGGLAALVQTREQRKLTRHIQAAMAVVEGYSEHAMDAVGARLLPAYEGLRDAMDRRRRSRSAPERLLERLLGLDLKLRQYELGRAFCDGVVERGGIELLNRVWESPEALPTPRELEQPAEWADRVASPAAA